MTTTIIILPVLDEILKRDGSRGTIVKSPTFNFTGYEIRHSSGAKTTLFASHIRRLIEELKLLEERLTP